jgi:Fe-S cluster assembly protein SufD
MISANNTQSWLDQHDSQALVGENITWLSEQRKAALSRFEEVGLPGVRDEEWRYTNLRALKSQAYQLGARGTKSDVVLPETNNPRLVFIDGHLDSSRSFVASIDGLIFTSTAAILTEEPDLLQGDLGSCLAKNQHGFTALNTAFFQDGYVISLARNTVVEGELEVYFIASQPGAVSHSRNVIVAAANSQCTVVERHLGSQGEVYLSNTLTEISASDNAHIDHYKIQQESDDAFHIGGVFINQARSSLVKNHNIALSGLVTRNDIHGNLLGQGAHLEMNGLVVGKGRQHIDNNTEVKHAVPNCTSDEYYKTVLDDQSRSVFRGRIVVAQDAQLTVADQRNNNLLLSKDAEADTKPQLEIYADDVKCSHGATVGQLDAKSMFYLRSRGINPEEAAALLTFAFANEVIDRVQVDSVKNELTQIMAGELLAGLEDVV